MKKRRNLQWLYDNIAEPNLLSRIDETEKAAIGQRAKFGYDTDLESRADWEKKAKIGLEIAEQIVQKKTTPWPGAANIKFPLIAIAAIQFAARAYPNIISGQDVVRYKVIGEDKEGKKAERGKRVAKHMSWQVLEDMDEWEEETDKLLHGLPVLGTYFKKTFRCPVLRRNKSVIINPLDLVINEEVKSILTARRISHNLMLYKNDAIERQNAGTFDGDANKYMSQSPEDKLELFVEQHCYFDLDGDGYEEPYIVTFHYDSGTVVRIKANYSEENVSQTDKGELLKIKPDEYFTKYSFIPAPSGKFYDLGFAHLLGPLNETINTILNQLVDAGTLANQQGGFLGTGIRMTAGSLRFKPGEWKPTQVVGGLLKDNIVPLPIKEPSSVLFQLLGTLHEAGMRLASVSEQMTGETPSQNTPATTTLAVLEQGLKVFTAIYKRIHRSLKREYGLLYGLNERYLSDEEYFTVLDEQQVVAKQDYSNRGFDIYPVSDPNLSSEALSMARSQALMETMQLNPLPKGRMAILKKHYEAIGADVEEVLNDKEVEAFLNAPPPPNPELIETQLKAVKQGHDYDMSAEKQKWEIELIKAQIAEVEARAAKMAAETDTLPLAQKFDQYMARIDQMQRLLEISTKREIEMEKLRGQGNSAQGGQGRTSPMAPKPNNQQGTPVLPGDPSGLGESVGAGTNGEPILPPSDGLGDDSLGEPVLDGRPYTRSTEPIE